MFLLKQKAQNALCPEVSHMTEILLTVKHLLTEKQSLIIYYTVSMIRLFS